MRNWIMPYLKQYKGRIALSVLFACIGVLSGAMLLFVSGYLISKSALRPENIMVVYVPVVSVRAFSIMQAAFPYVEKLVSHDIVLRILADYRKRLYNVLEPQAVFLQSRYQTGDILGVLSDDIEKLQDFYIRTAIPSIVGVVVYTLFAITIGFFDGFFMLLMLAILGIIIFLMPLISYYTMKKRHLTIKATRGKLYSKMTDAAFGQLDWVVSGRIGEIEAQIKAENNNLIQQEKRIYQLHHLRDAFLRFIVGATIVLMLFWTNLQVGENAITPTLIAAFVLMMFSITDALLPISTAVEEIPTYFDSIQRMDQFDVTEPIMVNKQQIQDNNNPIIDIDNLTYRYEMNEQFVIDELSLVIPAGKKIALLGKSGTGKSTLLKLITGIIQPTAGTIHIGEQPSQQENIGQLVGILDQKSHLFHTTIANNLRIGNPQATEEDMLAALTKAQIIDLVNSLPAGIHTQMEEMGQRFSGGERQRIAFARVLLQNTPILLMDEPTTGLDPQTELALLETILAATKDKTVIWVTHHLAGAEMMDEVIFMNEGRIAFNGNHQTLLETNDYYQSLYELERF